MSAPGVGASDLLLARAEAGELGAVLALLVAAGLPSEGVADGFPAGYVVFRQGGVLAGVAGLEAYGGAGLLRSVAVTPSLRGAGLGRRLVEERLEAAHQRGLSHVYLLTATAPDYFRRLGFREVPRASAPEALRRSPEFASICPGSAICLARALS